MARVLVVGFDGATWDLLSKFVADGTMPYLGGLQGTSAWGTLQSTIPPVTAPAWAALSTGKHPGKTGVFSFHLPTDSIDHFRPATSLDVKAETLPELLEGAGLKVHVVNLPTFSFPRKIRGSVLGDILCPADEVVQPKSLLETEPFRRYRAFPNVSLKSDRARYVQDVRELENVRFRCAQELFRTDWDFFFLMFSGVDWVQHELYADLLKGTDSHATALARSFYRDLDGYLSWMISNLGPEDYFFLVSDHGFRVVRRAFSINRWLRENGFLVPKKGPGALPGTLRRRSIVIPSRLLEEVARHRRLWSLGTTAWRRAAGTSDLAGMTRPDPSKTTAFMQDYTWGIRLNSAKRFRTGILDTDGEARVLRELNEKIEALVRQGILRACVPGGQVYSGPYASLGPDLVVIPGAVGIGGGAPGVRRGLESNGHSMEGVYMMHGPGASPGRGPEASICDIAPTVLAIFGLSVPDDMDGVALLGGAAKRSPSKDVRGGGAALSPEEERTVEERLRSLGYT